MDIQFQSASTYSKAISMLAAIPFYTKCDRMKGNVFLLLHFHDTTEKKIKVTEGKTVIQHISRSKITFYLSINSDLYNLTLFKW